MSRRITRHHHTTRMLVYAGVLLGACSARTCGAESALHRKIDAAIARVNAHFKSKPTVGARVVDLTGGDVVYSFNAERLLKPASNMKIITTATALALLGADFQFETVLAMRGDDLIVVGDGDPGLGDPKIADDRDEVITAVFHRWADALKERGVERIAGDLVIDDSIFDEEFVNPTWDPNQFQRWYSAPVGGLGFNDNCLDCEVVPTTSGKPVGFNLTPRLRNVEIVNKCISGRDKPPIIQRLGDAMKFQLGGGATRRIPLGPVTVVRPGLFFADACRTSLSAKGVKIEGAIRKARVRQPDSSLPRELDVIAVNRTPIAEVVTRANRDSQNYFAECLMKRAGYAAQRLDGAGSPTGSWPSGQEAIKRVLARIGVDPEDMVFADGAGLSHVSRVTPMAITEVLRAMHRAVVFPTFRDSLAASGGGAGTLSKRMRDIEGKVRAKTGYITGVRTMSGYVEGVGGRLFAFSILFNDVSGSTWPINDCHDRVCRLLASTKSE